MGEKRKMEESSQLLSPKIELIFSEDFFTLKDKFQQKPELKWKTFPKNMNNKLHTICSYMAMFPPSLPNYFIDKYSKEGDLVLDVFSGRGTTVLESCFMNRIGIGNDLNPLAFVLTKTKSNVPQKTRIIRRIEKLEKEFSRAKNIDIYNEESNIRMIFSDYTLRQLIFLKKKLNWRNNNIDAFITSLLLGIIHGGSEGYLSLKMPNTFSMAPNYVKNYIHIHGLIKPKRNVFELLKRKLERCYQRPPYKGKAYKQDARRMTRIKNSSIDLIITSPPYTRVIKYGQFNWIRLWFLGVEGKSIDKDLYFSQSIDKYCIFMSDVLKEIKRVLKTNSKAVLVIGDVRDRTSNKITKLAEIVWDRCAEPLGFKLIEPIHEDVINDSTKVSKIWGTKRGNATKIDRILVLKKI